jgi:hypothetical protein
MATNVISLRLPTSVDTALRASAANGRLSVSETLDRLLRYSVENSELLRELGDCSGRRNSKVDVRIPVQTLQQLKLASENLGISISVYTRRLLYHFYITRRVHYVKVDGHYTLAIRHD